MVMDVDDDRDIPDCWYPPVPAEYRPVPGWPQYRVGSDQTVWFNSRPDGVPPRWHRRRPRRVKGVRGRCVALRHDQREHIRSIDLLHRAAFSDPARHAAWARRLAPKVRVRAQIRAELGAELGREPGPVATNTVVPPGGLSELPTAPAAAPDRYLAEFLALVLALVEVKPVLPEGDPHAEAAAATCGSDHAASILTEPDVAEARRLRRDEGWSFNRLARKYGVHKGTVRAAVRGESWTHVAEPPVPVSPERGYRS